MICNFDAKIEFYQPLESTNSEFTDDHLELPGIYKKALKDQSIVTMGDVKFRVIGIESYSDFEQEYEYFTVYIELQWFGKPVVE